MLKEERLDYILKKLQTDHKVLHAELSNDLHVSEDTVRRDLEVLEKSGLLIKVRGGAIPHSPNPYSFKDRIAHHEEDKRTMAQKALSFLHDGQTVILDGGTSTYMLVKMFPPNLHLRVITNNIPIALQLVDHPSVEVILTGGRVIKNSQVTGGMDTIRQFQRMRAEICFLGICSVHPQAGVTGTDMEEAEVKASMVNASNKVIALATADKMGTAETFKVCDIGALNMIITDEPDISLTRPYKDLGIEVI